VFVARDGSPRSPRCLTPTSCTSRGSRASGDTRPSSWTRSPPIRRRDRPAGPPAAAGDGDRRRRVGGRPERGASGQAGLIAAGDRILAEVPVGLSRPDVAAAIGPDLLASGSQVSDLVVPGASPQELRFNGLNADGLAARSRRRARRRRAGCALATGRRSRSPATPAAAASTTCRRAPRNGCGCSCRATFVITTGYRCAARGPLVETRSIVSDERSGAGRVIGFSLAGQLGGLRAGPGRRLPAMGPATGAATCSGT
jgi:hypothetical protein